jgi:hypothetical protein
MRQRALATALAVALVLPVATGRSQAPGRPILLVVNRAAPNALAGYLAEIMRAEGLPAFNTIDVARLDARSLGSASLVVLAETPLTAAQASAIRNYVASGGRLIAMRPDAALYPALGITEAGPDGDERYVSIDTNAPAGSGLPSVTLPIKGPARHYRLVSEASAVAILRPDTGTPSFPAVVRSGRTVTWAYDLARSVVYSRQGDPANAGVDRDGSPPIRSVDVFYRAIDLDRVFLPHADVQMRLFSRLAGDLLADAFPVPRLWYFPNGALTLFVPTGDLHGHDPRVVRDQIASIEARGGQLTTYVTRYVPHPTSAEADAWRAAGHEFGLHPYGAADQMSLDAGFRAAASWFATRGPGKAGRTVRIHQIEWTSWVGPAQIEARHNIGMDTSFYTWGPAATYPDGHQAHGFINGSGLPMRFVDESGTIVPVYQQVTSIIDEQLAVGDSSEHLSPPEALAVARKLVDDSLNGGYSALVAQLHTDYFTWAEVRPWAEALLDYVRDRRVPMWTAERWLDYTEARAAAEVSGVSWSEPEVRFAVSVPAKAEALTVMLPAVYRGRGASSLTVDGRNEPLAAYTIAGRPELLFTVPAGRHEVAARFAADSPPAVAALPAPPPTAPTPPAREATAPVAAASPPSRPTQPAGSQAAASRPAPPPVFADCGGFDGTMLVAEGPGEIRLAGALTENFELPGLDSARWSAGTWSGGTFRPAPVNGVLSVAGPTGAYIRSTRPLNVTTVQASAQFAAAPWQHIGWGALDFAGPFVLFSTADTSGSITARTSLDGKSEQRTDIGPIPEGFHAYRIERVAQTPTTDIVRFFVDGEPRAAHSVPTLPLLHLYVSHNAGGSSAALEVRRLATFPPYVSRGTYTSCPIDAGATVTWGDLKLAATVPPGSSVQAATRTSADGGTWTDWSDLAAEGGGPIASPPGRFLEYRLQLQSSSPSTSPIVQAVTTTSKPAR